MYRKAIVLLLYQITRSLPPRHAGWVRRDPGRLAVLSGRWTLDVRRWTRRATRSLRLPVLTNQITRSLRLPVLTICCVAGAVSNAFSREKSSTAPLPAPALAPSPSPSPPPSPAPAPAPTPSPAPAPVPSPSDPEAVKPNSAVISIPADGEFYFGKVRVAEANLPEKMKQAFEHCHFSGGSDSDSY